MKISSQELEELRTKLAELELSDAQRHLLDAVLRIAWDLVGSQASLDAEFDGCFEPGEAEAIMAYLSAPRNHSITQSVPTPTGAASITRTV